MIRPAASIVPVLLLVLAAGCAGPGTSGSSAAPAPVEDTAPYVDPAVGTWVLDADATWAATRPGVLAAVPEEPPQEQLDFMREMFAQMRATLIVAEDGSVRGTMLEPMGEEELTVAGTWERAGGVVTLVTVDEQVGVEETMLAEVDGDTLLVQPAEQMEGPPVVMAFVRQP